MSTEKHSYEGRSYAKGKDCTIPEVSLMDLLLHSAHLHADKPAITFRAQTLTYAQFAGAVHQLAAALQAKGYQKGDRIALMLPNCPYYMLAFYAAMALGAIVVQVNPMYTERELDHVLADSGAKGIVVVADLYPRIFHSRYGNTLQDVIVVSFGTEPKDLSYGSNVVFYQDLVNTVDASAIASFRKPEIAPQEDIAVMQYTGGTTGRSKGALLTHRNLVANAYQISEHGLNQLVEDGEQPRYLIVVPLFHVYGMSAGMNAAVLNGAHMIVLHRFESNEVLETIKAYKPHYFPGVPTMYMALNMHPHAQDYQIDTIKMCISGSSPLPVELMLAFQRKTGAKMLEGYGLSEASPVTHITPRDGEVKAGSIGVTVPGTESRIVDLATGNETLPIGEVGELVVRGPQVMKGYWNMPEETNATIRDGWLYTGDIARMDEDGYFYIVDRKKDMIIAGGFNIYPREVEEVLYTHPKVQEVIVLGVPDEYRGETVHAHIVLKPGEVATEQEIIEFCRKHLAAYKVPRSVVFRDQLPKSAVGKILRRVIAEEVKNVNTSQRA
jgi:long-chain acyl-CoA synthetase